MKDSILENSQNNKDMSPSFGGQQLFFHRKQQSSQFGQTAFYEKDKKFNLKKVKENTLQNYNANISGSKS